MARDFSFRAMLGVVAVLMPTMIVVSWAQESNECSELTLPTGLPLFCPTREKPDETDCCYGEEPYCCRIEPGDQRLVYIALSVIVSCFALTIIVVICCFCPRCLLYDACRSKYTQGEIITYTKEEEMALNSTMPYEDQTEKSSYSTQSIKIKRIADV